ncbi:interleukin-15 receptor subunit alpha isoform X1 [Amia ocellicauda]|uniref:interleukin-15 receptor subunit alpha isoform X1 n=1 Tax=Amia ocellicauda TaxID=2972642 RepID=UPI003463E318
MTCHVLSLTLFVLFPLANNNHHDTVSAAGDSCSPPAATSLTVPPDPYKRYSKGDIYRYSCSSGYKRKAGTSNLIRCEEKNKTLVWSDYALECIRDPALKGKTTPTIATSQESTATSRTSNVKWRGSDTPDKVTPTMSPTTSTPLSTVTLSTGFTRTTPEKDIESTTSSEQYENMTPTTTSFQKPTFLLPDTTAPEIASTSEPTGAESVPSQTKVPKTIGTPSGGLLGKQETVALGVSTVLLVIVLSSLLIIFILKKNGCPRSRQNDRPPSPAQELEPFSPQKQGELKMSS